MNHYINSRWLSAEHLLWLASKQFWMPYKPEMWIEIIVSSQGIKMKELILI